MTVELSILFVIQIHAVGIPNPSLFVERSWLPVSRAASVSGSLTNNATRKRSGERSPCLGHTPKRRSRAKDWWITLACSKAFPLMNRGHRAFHQCTQWNMVRYIVYSTNAHNGTWYATSCIPPVHTVERVIYIVLSTSAHSGTCHLHRAVHQCIQWNVSARKPVDKNVSVEAELRAQCANLCHFQTFSILWSFLTIFPVSVGTEILGILTRYRFVFLF